MPIPLCDVLDDPTLAAADPVVLAGGPGLRGNVRWVHTSEVFEIADLLRGGELLLIGGVALAAASTSERQEYIRALAARGVAGLAIETGRRLPRVPPELVEQADRLGLPLIELRRVVPFVSVTEAINGLLVNQSVRRLQLADRVSHALSSALAAGSDPDELLEVLGREIGADAELVSLTGDLIACSARPGDDPTAAGPGAGGGSAPDGPATLSAPVTTAGVTVATLVLRAHPGSDPVLVEAARDRAPEVLGVALLRSRPLSMIERDAREFVSIAGGRVRDPARFTELAGRLGLADRGPWVAVIGRLGGHHLRTSGIDEALRRGGRVVVSHLHDESYLAVVALGGGTLGRGRADIVDALRSSALPSGLRVAVGPGSRSLHGLGRCLREAQICLDIGDSGAVVDAAELGVQRLLIALDRSEVVADFVDEHLGELLGTDARRQDSALETLACYLQHLGSKTDTAEALHIQRQSLYQRLGRIFDVVDARPGSPRLGAVLIAVELEVARRRGVADAPRHADRGAATGRAAHP